MMPRGGSITPTRSATKNASRCGPTSSASTRTLLLEERFDQPAARCPSCGLLLLDGDHRCPIDGTELEQIDHLREAAVEAAVAQDADVMVVNHYPDLGPFRGIGALLRF
jgi:hypothetical protein